MTRLADFVDTHANPLMLKETYQGVRSGAVRLLSGLGLVVPLVAHGLTVTVLGPDGDAFERTGYGLSVVLTSVLCLVCCLLIPLRAAQQLKQEIKTHTLDLIMLTQLSPWQLAVGRFQAAAIQVLLVFAYALPFGVAAFAMGGVSLFEVVGSLLTLFLLSLLQCSAVLAAASACVLSSRLGALAIAMTMLQMLTSGVGAVFSLNRPAGLDIHVIGWLACLLALGILLCLRLATDTLTVSAARTFASSKACLAAWLATYFTPLWLGAASGPLGLDDQRQRFVGFGLAVLYLFAFLWAAARTRDLRGHPFWRWLIADGREATMLYCAVITAVLSGVAALRSWPAELLMLCFALFVSCTGVAALVCSLLGGARTYEQYLLVLIGVFAVHVTWAGLSTEFFPTSRYGIAGQILVALLPLSIKSLAELRSYMPALGLMVMIGLAATICARRIDAGRVFG